MPAQAASARQDAAGSFRGSSVLPTTAIAFRGCVRRPPERLVVVPVVVRDPDPFRFDPGDALAAAVEDVALQCDPVGADVGVQADVAGVVDDVAAYDGSVVTRARPGE
jgi:hypothetical protein